MKSIYTILFALFPAIVLANEPRVTAVTASHTGGAWRFDVTVQHEDGGWDHYADGWGIYDLDGRELGYRILLHPHVNEQPFTRTLNAVVIPTSVETVIIRPHDSVHGDGPDFKFELEWGARD